MSENSSAIENGGPASAFSLARAGYIRGAGCTATRIASRYFLSAAHCPIAHNHKIMLYTNGPAPAPNFEAKVEEAITPSGVEIGECDGPLFCNDDQGLFGDIAVVRVSNIVGSDGVDELAGTQATLAWRWPGDNVLGIQVGAGERNGVPNSNHFLYEGWDYTDDAIDDEGSFRTATANVDSGDSGGPFYVNNRIVGTLTGHSWDPGDLDFALYTSVPKQLDWILRSINYRWFGQPVRAGKQYDGGTIESIVPATLRICQYACEKTTACEAYNYNSISRACSLKRDVENIVSGTSGSLASLKYGARSGASGSVAGYVREDDISAVVVPRSTQSTINELHLNSGWHAGSISWGNAPAPTGSVTAYRRSDGTNAVVYRSATQRIIEITLAGNVWSWADLNLWGGGLPVGTPVAIVGADGVSSVFYRSTNQHIWELRLGTNEWNATDLTAATGNVALAHSDPSVFVRSDGRTSVLFRRGGEIWEISRRAGEAWSIGSPSTNAGNPTPAASRPFGVTYKDGTNAIIYRTTSNRIVELWLEGGSWHDSEASLSAPDAMGDPVAYVRSDSTTAIVYRSSTRDIIEIALTSTGWSWTNLSQFTGAGDAYSDPSVYVRADGLDAIVFRLATGNVAELAHSPGVWWANDISDAANEN